MLVGLTLLWMNDALAQDAGGVYLGAQPAPEQPDYYLIQTGDTLWDISTRFMGDPRAWPDLWSINDYITNPHWIYPGNRIHFTLGDRLNPPGVSLAEVESADGYVPPEPEAPVQASAESACALPAPFASARTGVTLSSPGVLSTPDELGIRGKIYAASSPGMNVVDGALVYIEMEDAADVECGQVLSVYRRQGGRVRHEGEALGWVYRVLGEAQVIRVDDDIVTARVRDTWAEMRRGDVVGDSVPVEIELDVNVPEGDTEASVLARLHPQMLLPAAGETLFLDRGTDDGVDVGHALWLVRQNDGSAVRGAKPDSRLPQLVVGRAVVVRAAEGHSAAVVFDMAREAEFTGPLVATPNAE